MAVYTEIPDGELAEYLVQYEIGGLHSLKGIAEGVENSNYLLSTDAGMYILTLYEKRVNPDDLPFFLGLKDHLANNGIVCPRPVAMTSGEQLGRLAGRPSAIITYLDGNSVKRPRATHCEQVGDALARMHLASQGFSKVRANALGSSGWRTLYKTADGQADSVVPGLASMIENELGFLETNWPSNLPSGIIHADLFPDNVFFLKDKLSGLIDFYFACNDLLAFDLAICLNAWCFEPDNAFNVTKANRMLAAYHAVRPLNREETQALPVLCRGAAMRFLLTRLYDWLNVPPGALVTPLNPAEYIEKLKFHQGVQSAAEYGFSV